MKILKKTSIYFFGLFTTYLLYFFPYDSLNFLIFSENIFQIKSLFFSILFYLIIFCFFKFQLNFFPIRFLIYEGMGIGFICLWVIFLFLIINIISDINSYILGISAFFSIFFLVIISLIKGRLIKLKKINIYSKKLKNEYKFIFISDVHLGSNNQNHLKNIITKIKKLNFDILLIGGDLIDSSKFDISNFLTFKDLKKPILFVTGNHELYLKNWKLISRSLSKYNIINIDNIGYKFKEINIIGIGDDLSINEQKVAIKKSFIKNHYNIAMIHKPTLWKRTIENLDLVISGHTHNGQIFPFNLLVMSKFKNIYGLYEDKDSFLYVSSGVGCWGPRMRLGSQNEIVMISLSKKS